MQSNSTPNEKALERLLEENEFLTLEKEFCQYCPFEALGMIRSEVRHGNFLAYFMDPSRPHGFGSKVLRAFLLAIARNTTSQRDGFHLSPLDVHLMDIEQADVRREWRNIDLLIVLRAEKLVIPIELKIDATQGDGQLQKYLEIVEREWPGWHHLNVFLTKNDEKPQDANHWQSLRIRDLVKELEPITKTAGTSAASESLRAYVRMLRRHHLEDERLEEIARKLWSRHKEALEFLAARRPDAIGELFDAVKASMDKLAINIAGSQVVPDTDNKNIIRFAYAKWDDLPGFKQATWTESKRFILLELKREGSSLNAYLHLGPGDQDARKSYASLLEKGRLNKGSQYICLAKKENLNDEINDEADFAESIDKVKKSFQQFAQETFNRFDLILTELTVAPGSGS